MVLTEDRRKHAASEIVDGIIEDLNDRRGGRQMWDSIDEDIRQEIRASWIEIVDLGIKGLKF